MYECEVLYLTHVSLNAVTRHVHKVFGASEHMYMLISYDRKVINIFSYHCLSIPREPKIGKLDRIGRMLGRG